MLTKWGGMGGANKSSDWRSSRPCHIKHHLNSGSENVEDSYFYIITEYYGYRPKDGARILRWPGSQGWPGTGQTPVALSVCFRASTRQLAPSFKSVSACAPWPGQLTSSSRLPRCGKPFAKLIMACASFRSDAQAGELHLLHRWTASRAVPEPWGLSGGYPAIRESEN